MFMCDADSKEFIFSDNNVLTFPKTFGSVVDGGLLFKVASHIKTRDWENIKSDKNIFGPLKRSFVLCAIFGVVRSYSCAFQVISMTRMRLMRRMKMMNTKRKKKQEGGEKKIKVCKR